MTRTLSTIILRDLKRTIEICRDDIENDDWRSFNNRICEKYSQLLLQPRIWSFILEECKIDPYIVLKSFRDIPIYMFYGSALKKIIIPANIGYVPGSTFADSKIEEIIFEGETVNLSCKVFEDCPNLSEVVFPTRYMEINCSPLFTNTHNLKHIVLPKEMISYDEDILRKNILNIDEDVEIQYHYK